MPRSLSRDLVVDRGGRRVLDGLSFAVPHAPGHRPARAERQRQDHAHARARRRAGGRSGDGHGAGSTGGVAPACGAAVGYLTQAPSVYADLTVRENARYFAALYGHERARGRRAPSPTSGLADAAGQLVGDLSGGQRGRASLACALVGEPEVLVLDEPTVGQDPVLRVELWAAVPRAGAAGDDAAGVQPRDGRGRPLRPPAADPRGTADRRRHAGRRCAPRPAPTTSKRRSCA